VAKLPTHNPVFRFIWTADSYVSSALFETWDLLKRASSAYSSWLYRYFRISGLSRLFFGLVDDGLTLGTIFLFGLLAYALPPFSGSGDVWNRGREYAVTFTDANGEIIGRRGIRQDDAIPLEEIPPHLIKAVLATEDARFFDHFGIDIIGTLRAVVRNAKNDGVVQGGSSITQQVAKNIFLSPERTLRRKVNEAFFALWIEAHLTKEEILKLYLDRSYLGGGAYGVEAAAQFYFGKSVRDVSVSESAILAGLFKAPTNYAPHQDLEAARGRANVVLYRMLDAGFISQGDLLQARRNPAAIVAAKNITASDWFLDYAYQDTIDVLEKYGLTKDFVIEVKTSVDVKLQNASQEIMNDVIDTLGPDGRFTQGASVTMAPDGAVKAIVGGRDYEVSQFNRATDAERQSGSSFKPYVYLAALLDGHTPNERVVDGPVSVGGWSPGNYKDEFHGATTLTIALAKSYNSIPVKLMQAMGGRAGRDKIIKVAHDVGVQGELETWPPMVLGTSALTLLDLSTGYATFAGGGKLARPYAVLEIRKANGDLIYERSKVVEPAPQVVPEDKIAELNAMMEQVVKAGTARSADLEVLPQAGKTGTNQGYRDAWYVGYTGNNVTGVWVGNDDFSPMNDITGGKVPAPAWKRIMEVAEADLPPVSLAGVPYDERFVVAAEAKAKRLAEEKGATTTEDAIAATPPSDTKTGVAGVTMASTAAEEAPAATPEQQPVVEESDAVLNGMFSMFEKRKAAKSAAVNQSAQQPRVKRSKKQRTEKNAGTIYDIATPYSPYNEPKPREAREKRSFIDKLLGRNPNKKRKKKLFFEF
jgi:penicillin-binding protein 1A